MILSILNFLDSLLLVDLNLETDLAQIIHQDISLEHKSDIWRNIQEIKPVLLTNEETFNDSKSGVNESCSLVESNSVSTDDTLIFELNTVSSLFVNFVANNNFSLIDEADLVEFVKLVNKNGMPGVLSRF
mgnify:CR=1 FL=1